MAGRTGWRAAAGGAGLGLSAGWNLSNVGAIADETARAYGVSLTVVGVFTTALFVMHAAMQIPAGRLADRLGARRVGMAGLVVVAGCSTAALASPSPSLAVAMRTLTGIGTAVCFVGGSDYVRAAGGTPFAQGVFGAAGVGGAGVALAVVPQVERLVDWRAPYVTSLLAALAGAAVLATGPRERPRPPRRGAADAARLWHDRLLWRLGAVHSASFGLSVLIGDWVVTLLERAGGFSSGVAGGIGSLTLVLGVVTRPWGGAVMRGRPERIATIVAWSFVAGAIGTVALAAAEPLALAIAASAVVGLASGVPFAYAFSGAAAARPDAPAAAVGFVNMLAAAAVLVGNPLLGLGFSAPGDGRIGFAVVAALWLAALAAVPRAASRPATGA
ncbi:MAG TPA: MFS transporter [Gaiellaceae bacterium]|nr:MFS transporter [Gaiellaceae bacterium]